MKRTMMIAASAAALLLAAGCASTDEAGTSRISELENQLETTEQSLAEERAAKNALANQVKSMGEKPAMETDRRVGGNADLPPNAKPGHCYARVLIPATYKTSTEQVIARGESERVETTPAKYGTNTKRVLVAEESERIEVRPATYKTVTERVLVQPARTTLIATPAKYETQSERVLVRQAYTTWKKGRGPVEKLDQATGEIMCLVEVPAEYRTVSKRVQVTAPGTREVTKPAVYRTVTRRVVDTPAATRTVKIPAKYSTIKVQTVVQPASQRTVKIPAKYQTVSKRVKVNEESLEWREILCDTNTTGDVVRRLQRALKAKNINPGPIDGVYGSQTRRAVNAYQKRAGLPTGALTIRTLNSLGVKLGNSA
jgi:hypothetical protein